MHDHDLMMMLMDEANCGFVERKCHKFAEGGVGVERAILYLLRYIGYVRVHGYLLEISTKISVVEEVRLVAELYDNMKTLIMEEYLVD